MNDMIPIGKATNIIGKRYGKLVVLYRVEPPKTITTKKPKSFWKCQCDCGNLCVVSIDRLNNGSTQSCGCISREKASERFMIDMVGQKYGKLTVIERDPQKSNSGRVHWLCKCDCGNKKLESIDGMKLRQGKKLQCSLCQPRSKGEEQIRDILTINNISFIQEKSFDDCRFPDTKRLARFDFYVNEQYIIEFDGRQHIEPTTGSKANWWSLEYVQGHDKIKNDYCKENNIPLIRIPYTKVNFIKLEDLLLETTKYRKI